MDLRRANIKDILEEIEGGLLVVGSIAVFLMMVLLMANVVLRYVFQRPITGTYEVTRLFLLPILILLAWPYVLLVDEDIRLDLLFDKLSDTYQRGLDLFFQICMLGVFSLVIYTAVDVAVTRTAARATTTLGVPMYLSNWIVVVGSALILVRLALLVYQAVR